MKIIFASYHLSDVEKAMEFAEKNLEAKVSFEPLLGFNTLSFDYLVLVVAEMDLSVFKLLSRIKTKKLEKKIILSFKDKSEILRTNFCDDLCYTLKVESFFLLGEAESFFRKFGTQLASLEESLRNSEDEDVEDDIDSEVKELKTKENFEALKYLDEFIELYYPSGKQLFDHFLMDYQTTKFKKKKINEIKRLAEKIYLDLKKDKEVAPLLKNIYLKYPSTLNHTFLSSVFAALIAQNLSWAEDKTIELVIKGALLQNIGYLNFENELNIENREKLSADERFEFEKHPVYGYNSLSSTGLSLQIKQIVYQHKEYLDGSGYPNGLSGMNIFPLARIVCFASDFARIVSNEHLSPVLGIKQLIRNRELLLKYEANCIKAFIKGMV